MLKSLLRGVSVSWTGSWRNVMATAPSICLVIAGLAGAPAFAAEPRNVERIDLDQLTELFLDATTRPSDPGDPTSEKILYRWEGPVRVWGGIRRGERSKDHRLPLRPKGPEWENSGAVLLNEKLQWMAKITGLELISAASLQDADLSLYFNFVGFDDHTVGAEPFVRAGLPGVVEGKLDGRPLRKTTAFSPWGFTDTFSESGRIIAGRYGSYYPHFFIRREIGADILLKSGVSLDVILKIFNFASGTKAAVDWGLRCEQERKKQMIPSRYRCKAPPEKSLVKFTRHKICPPNRTHCLSSFTRFDRCAGKIQSKRFRVFVDEALFELFGLRIHKLSQDREVQTGLNIGDRPTDAEIMRRTLDGSHTQPMHNDIYRFAPVFLEVLYHRKLKPGMTRDVARPIVKGILWDLAGDLEVASFTRRYELLKGARCGLTEGYEGLEYLLPN